MRTSLGRRLIPAVLGVMEARSVPMLAGGAGLAETRTAAVNLFVVVELFYLFSCRSLTHSMWRVRLFSNRWIVGGVTVQVIAQAAITYLPVIGPAAEPAAALAPAAVGLIEALTDRELEILRLVAAGLHNREIATELVVTLDTVKKHLSHIFRKLEASSRTQAVARARDLGLISS